MGIRRQRQRVGTLVVGLLASACTGGADAPWLTAPTPETHDRFFPIATGPHAVGSGSPATTCNTCHGNTDSFVVFDCTTCHTQAATAVKHLNQGGYEWTSPSCYACHPRGSGTISAEAHASFFPIGPTDAHAYGKTLTVGGVQLATSCSSCHVDSGNRRNVDCTSCHVQSGTNGTAGPTVPADQDQAHAGKLGTSGTGPAPWLGTGPVGNGTGASAQCLACHGLAARGSGFVATHGSASAATGNAVFPIDARSAHFTACAQCHTQTTVGQPLKNPEADFTKASCTACHAASGPGSVVTEHAAIPYKGQPGVTIDTSVYQAANANNAAACLACHATGGQASGFVHTAFPLTSQDNAMTAGGAAFAHNTVARCADCHTPGQPVTSVLAITCRGCHSDFNPAGQNGATLTAKHSVGVVIWTVPGKWSQAPAGSTSTTDSSLCLQCHAGNNASSRSSSRLVLRLTGHDNGCSPRKPIGRSGDHSVNQNGNNGQGNGQPACFVCHNALGTPTRPWSRNWASVNNGTLGCQGCHEHAGDNPSYSQCP